MKNIKIFSDFACPFCFIGFSIIDKLRKENKDLNIEWMPFELSPDAPPEGSDLSDSIPEDQLEMAYRRINRLGSEYGLIYNNKTRKFNTHRLHKASLYADSVPSFVIDDKKKVTTLKEYKKIIIDILE